MTVALTQAAINALKPGLHRAEVPDGSCRGLWLVIQPSGARSWALRHRTGGKSAKLTLGPYPAIGLKEARKRAVEAQAALGRGEDPGAAKKALREARRTPDARDTVAGVVDRFIARHVRVATRPKSARETERILRRDVVGAWGDRKLTDVKRRDVHDLLESIIDRGSPVMANRVLAACRRMCSWAVERDLIPASPCDGVRPPARETSRDRVLSDDEIRCAWAAFSEMGRPFGDIFEVMLLTGQRETEVGAMEWSELDLASLTWTLPPARAKNATGHVVPLAPTVVAIIAAQPRIGDHVFSTNGRTAPSGWSRAKARLDTFTRNDGDNPWRLHDLRRTAATGLARLGVAPHVVEAILNHRSGTIRGISATYNRFAYSAEKKEALEIWAAEVERIVKS